MRGKGQNQRGTGSGRRITPAYAGKSTHQPPSGRGTRGHPHVCGEKCGYRLPFRSIVGSPPTVRGKVHFLKVRLNERGITPAYAGKSHWESLRRSPPEDHPRVCGEKTMRFIIASTVSGSPPRMRGKGGPNRVPQPRLGITPAYAGKRGRKEIAPMSNRDHPRVCGEKLFQSPLLRLPLGSSPRVRGKGTRPPFLRNGAGITPACAGKSSCLPLLFGML